MGWLADIKAWFRRMARTDDGAISEPSRADQLTYIVHWSAVARRYVCRVQELPEVAAGGMSLAEALEGGRGAAREALERRVTEGVALAPPKKRLPEPEPEPPEGPSFETRFKVRVGPPRKR